MGAMLHIFKYNNSCTAWSFLTEENRHNSIYIYMAALTNILKHAVKTEHFPGPKGMDLSANVAIT